MPRRSRPSRSGRLGAAGALGAAEGSASDDQRPGERLATTARRGPPGLVVAAADETIVPRLWPCQNSASLRTVERPTEHAALAKTVAAREHTLGIAQSTIVLVGHQTIYAFQVFQGGEFDYHLSSFGA